MIFLRGFCRGGFMFFWLGSWIAWYVLVVDDLSWVPLILGLISEGLFSCFTMFSRDPVFPPSSTTYLLFFFSFFLFHLLTSFSACILFLLSPPPGSLLPLPFVLLHVDVFATFDHFFSLFIEPRWACFFCSNFTSPHWMLTDVFFVF